KAPDKSSLEEEKKKDKEKTKDADEKETKAEHPPASSTLPTTAALSSATQRAQALESVLKQNPRFWGLAHIPLNLALICESWPYALSEASVKENKDKDRKTVSTADKAAASLNLVQLYQNVLTCFLRRDAVKYRANAQLTDFATLSASY